MYIPNFSSLAQFEGELCEEQTKKMKKKNGQKTSFLGQKNRDPQKAHLGPLVKVHTQFKLLSSIRRGVTRGTKSRNDRNERPILWGCEGVKWSRKVEPPQKAHLGPLPNVHNQFKLLNSI